MKIYFLYQQLLPLEFAFCGGGQMNFILHSVTLTFHSAFPVDEDFKGHDLKPGDFCPLENTLIRESPTLLEGTLSGA